MSKTLIICEKPSVATEFARVLSKAEEIDKFAKKTSFKDAYFENETMIIASAVGHLLEYAKPQNDKGKSLAWKFDNLPILPQKFDLEPVERTQNKLKSLLKLAKSKEVSLIVNACDAGREGELIFRNIIAYGKIDKPIERIWLQSMTQDSILEAWKNRKSNEEMLPLSSAASCRAEADWLIGMNGTRSLTCFKSRHGGFLMTPVGRVQTPTLSLLVEREKQIQKFTSLSYFQIKANFSIRKGNYESLYIDEDWKADEDDTQSKANRIWEKETAENIIQRCEGKEGEITEEKKEQRISSPLLYDLTSLQRESSKRFGLSAKYTLQICQTLYEKHKMITYPRTGSRYLPEDYLQTVKKTIGSFSKNNSSYASIAEKIQKENLVTPSKRIFNNAKISDHFAIIPTGKFVGLSELEEKLFSLITQNFLGIFLPPSKYEVTKRWTRIIHSENEKDAFITEGRIIVDKGWLIVRNSEKNFLETLVPLEENEEKATLAEIELLEKETQPPARYNEATLLSAMEKAGKFVEDEELQEAMKERGLGTPATRATIIENLIQQKYIEREGRDFLVSNKSFDLLNLIKELQIEEISSPSLTGEWEYKLGQVEKGRLTGKEFMKEILSFSTEIVQKSKDYIKELQSKTFPEVAASCPRCQATPLQQTDSTYECPSCDFRVKKYFSQHLIDEKEIKELCENGKIGPFSDFKSRFNQNFEACIILDENFKANFEFLQGEEISLKEANFVGKYMTFNEEKGELYASEKAYLFQLEKGKDPIRIGKTILQKEIEEKEIVHLIEKGKTNLIEGFISKRTKRPFSAYLSIDFATGKISFSFPERTNTKKTAKKAS